MSRSETLKTLGEVPISFHMGDQMKVLHRLRDQRGTSLPSVLAGITVVGITAVGTMNVAKMMTDTQSQFGSYVDSVSLQEELMRMTSAPALCMERFGATQKSLSGKEKSLSIKIGSDVINGENDLANYKLNDVSLQVERITEVGGGAPGYKTYAYEMALRSTARGTQMKYKDRSIPVTYFLVDGTNSIVNCTSKFELLGSCTSGEVPVSTGPGNIPSCKTWPKVLVKKETQKLYVDGPTQTVVKTEVEATTLTTECNAQTAGCIYFRIGRDQATVDSAELKHWEERIRLVGFNAALKEAEGDVIAANKVMGQNAVELINRKPADEETKKAVYDAIAKGKK